MKKRIAVFLVLILVLVLGLFAGCAPKAQDTQTQETETAAQETQQDEKEEKDTASQVATAEEMTEVVDVVEEGMVPVTAAELKDGTYDVVMKSSSSMFKADHVQVVVENGTMKAVLYMTSKAYLYMFAGTAQEAAAADEADYIQLEQIDEEMGTFTLPISGLNEGISFAAFSKKKEKWYDRTLLFRADSLPDEAFLESRQTKLSDLGLEDGAYTVEVTLEGGSGKASVESPAVLNVSGDTATSVIIWSSKNYDFMMVNGTKYEPIELLTEGNSTFEIPVSGFDYPMPVQADTTAMSQPYLIDYTLTFDSSTITPAS